MKTTHTTTKDETMNDRIAELKTWTRASLLHACRAYYITGVSGETKDALVKISADHETRNAGNA